MKRFLPFFVILVLLLSTLHTRAQVSVVSNNGYTVNITVIPQTIVPSSSSCQYGYNYNVRMQYSVTFTGTNQPGSLYTLQGRLGCGTNSHFFDLPNGQGSGQVTSQSNVWRSVSDCNSATVTSLLCNTVTIEIEGPGISRRHVTFVTVASPLPVKLTSFTASAADSRVLLNWATAAEENSDRFIIERKKGGSSDWETITTVQANGTSTSQRQYASADLDPYTGNSEYRLAMVDKDGRMEYSAVQLVNFTGKTASVRIYPVPVTNGVMNFSGLANRAADYDFSLLSVNGTVIVSQTLSKASVQVPELKKGLYLVRLVNRVTGEVSSLRYMQ